MAKTKKLSGAAKIAHEKKLAAEKKGVKTAKALIKKACVNKAAKLAEPTIKPLAKEIKTPHKAVSTKKAPAVKKLTKTSAKTEPKKPTANSVINKISCFDVNLDKGTIHEIGADGKKRLVKADKKTSQLINFISSLIGGKFSADLNPKVRPVSVAEFQALHPAFDHRNKMAAFFGKDSDVTVTLDFNPDLKNCTPIFNIVVAGCAGKADAMRQLLNGSFKIGNLECKLLVNGRAKSHKEIVTLGTIETAFSSNALFSRLYVKFNPDKTLDRWCILWNKESVAFPNDRFNSYCGMECHSAEDLAREVLHGKVNSVLMHATEMGESNGYWDTPTL